MGFRDTVKVKTYSYFTERKPNEVLQLIEPTKSEHLKYCRKRLALLRKL